MKVTAKPSLRATGSDARASKPARTSSPAARSQTPRTKVVYTQPPTLLARLVGREGDRWRVRIAAEERLVRAEPDVDVALLEQVAAQQGRVVLDDVAGEATIAGVLMTTRALGIDAQGDVAAKVRSLRIDVEKDATLVAPEAFLRVRPGEVEVYGVRVLTRAREVAKILAAMIKLN